MWGGKTGEKTEECEDNETGVKEGRKRKQGVRRVCK